MKGRKPIDLTGKQFGRWTVLEFLGTYRKIARWRCRCSCGTVKDLNGSMLRHNRTLSCGCYRAELPPGNLQHGGASGGEISPEYAAWRAMRRRCLNPNDTQYSYYGGRGISICDRWNTFSNFLADMGKKPSSEHSIDRFPDNDGPYSPENCRWATRSEQCLNRRSNRRIELNGETRCLKEWCEIYGMPLKLVSGRINASGWSPEKALTTPILGHKEAA